MYRKLQFIILLFLCFACTEKKNALSKENIWTKEMLKTHLSNREDSTKWDLEMFKNDLENNITNLGLPISNGIFPVPKYDLLVKNSFNGVGNFGFPGGAGSEFKIKNKTILFNSFFAGSNYFNKTYLSDGAADEIFFQIIILTDFVDTLNYTHLLSEIVSRNHPDYIGQGFYKTKESKIDYNAFITADRKAHAIVNMRLFDLANGKTILIAPQKDKSMRSLQIQSLKLSSKQIENYTKGLMKKEKIIKFFTAKGNI